MGNTQSKITSLQILKIKEDSPTKDLLPFIHFITKYNNNEIKDKSDITSMVKTWETNNLDLEIIDVRTNKISTVLIPKKNGKNLGISVKLLETAIFMLQMCILDVQNGSPAFTAGLIEKQDYIIGVENVSLLDDDEFFSHLYKNHGKVVVLIVYNLGMKSLRRVEIIPRKEVLLGCEIGSGMLYNIPEDDVMFDWRCDTVRRAFYEQKEKEEIEKHKLETEIEERQENEKEANDHNTAVQASDGKTDESRAKESGDKAESIGLPLSDLQIEQKKNTKNTEPILTEQKVENNANENISNTEGIKEEMKEHDVDNVHNDATKYDTYESECQDNTEKQEKAAFCNIDCKINMDYEEDAKDNNFGCESIKQVSNAIVCEYPEEENANDNEGITFDQDNKEAETVVDSNYDIGVGDEITKQENCSADVHCADSLESANLTDVHASTGLLNNTDMTNKQNSDYNDKPAENEVTNEPIVDIEQVASGHVNASVNLETDENFVDFDDIDENIESATEIQYDDSEDYTEQVTVHSDVFKLTEILNGSDGEPFEFSDDIEQLNKTLTEDQDCNNICNDLKCMAGIDNNVVQGDTSHLFDDDYVEFTLDMPKYDLQNEHASNLTKELKMFDCDLMHAKHPVDVHEDTAASDENTTGYTSQKSDCHSDPGVEDYL